MTNRGFTLIELTVALLILGLLLSIGLPAFGKLIEQQRVDSGLGLFSRSLNFARQEAVRLNRPVTVAAIDEDWNQGWVIFLDSNHDGRYDEGERLLLQVAADEKLRMHGNTPVARYVRFNAVGESQLLNGGFQAGTFRFCPQSPEGMGRKLVVNRVGRWRVERTVIEPEYCGG
ncbi:MAG: GspH/FimT family pseudopilin [Pseudomonas sp.]